MRKEDPSWQYGLSSFQRRDNKLDKDFWPKINIHKGNVENDLNNSIFSLERHVVMSTFL